VTTAILVTSHMVCLNRNVCIVEARKKCSNARPAFKICDDLSNMFIGSLFGCAIWQAVNE
jgi:hypothetical protein